MSLLFDLAKNNVVEFQSKGEETSTFHLTTKDGTYTFEIDNRTVKLNLLERENDSILFLPWIKKALNSDKLIKI